jgi:hypothetical protein
MCDGGWAAKSRGDEHGYCLLIELRISDQLFHVRRCVWVVCCASEQSLRKECRGEELAKESCFHLFSVLFFNVMPRHL